LEKSDIEMIPLDVNDVVGETIALVQRELISHQVSLRTELTSPLPMVLGDRVQLQQVDLATPTPTTERKSLDSGFKVDDRFATAWQTFPPRGSSKAA
jgi:hypothetical protein